jgi:NitT/TauT family transport system ATP-binding protein
MNRMPYLEQPKEQLSPVGEGLRVEGLCKSFGSLVIFDQLSLHFPDRQITALLGCNGCGKSTLINLLSGLLPCDRGHITLNGKLIQRSRIGYVFQDYRASLFPWLTAADNLRYPLKLQKIPPGQQRDQLVQLITTYDVKFNLDRYPHQLSGGQQQLLAILRAVIARPDVLFLDEPFSALDFATRLAMREQLQRICLDLAVPTVIISHDLDEAIYLADRIVILGQHPTQVIVDIPVPLPRPHQPQHFTDSAFIQVKQHCLEVFQSLEILQTQLVP